MIFFGSRGKVVSGNLVEGIQCPSCENKQFITFGVIRYFHLYWIPTFPLSKVAGIECTHCKKTMVDKELSPDLSRQIKENVFNKKNTIPMFSGLIVIGFIALFMTILIQKEGLDKSSYIAQPAINDFYITNFSKIYVDSDPKYKYGLMRIKNIDSDEVEFQVSGIVYNKVSGVRKDIRSNKVYLDSYYDGDPLYIDRENLKSLDESGAIYAIERLARR